MINGSKWRVGSSDAWSDITKNIYVFYGTFSLKNIFSFLSCFINSDSILLLTKLLTREDFYSDTSYM